MFCIIKREGAKVLFYKEYVFTELKLSLNIETIILITLVIQKVFQISFTRTT